MTIARMKNGRGTDLLPWILMGLSAVIMCVAVGVYSSDAEATNTGVAAAAQPGLMDTQNSGAAIYGPVAEASQRRAAPQARPAQL